MSKRCIWQNAAGKCCDAPCDARYKLCQAHRVAAWKQDEKWIHELLDRASVHDLYAYSTANPMEAAEYLIATNSELEWEDADRFAPHIKSWQERLKETRR